MSPTIRTAVLGVVLLATLQIGASGNSPESTAVESLAASDLFQWYGEFDSVDYWGSPPSISRTIPAGRVAVIDFVTFNASQAECALAAVTVRTTFRGLGSLHTIVGVVDLGPARDGRSYGLSQPAKIYVDGGQPVTAWVRPAPANTSCLGDGLDFTLTGHYVKRR